MRTHFAPILACAFLLLRLPLPLAAEAGAAGDDARFQAILSALESCGPRLEGSAGEASAQAFIAAAARKAGLAVSRDDLSRIRHSHSFSSSLSCRLEGRLQDTLIVALPLDSGARGAASPGRDFTLALGVWLMEELAAAGRPGVSVEFAFLGAEFPLFPDDADYPRGSLSLIAGLPEGRRTAVLYLSLDRPCAGVFLANYGPGVVSPFWYFRLVLDSLPPAGFSASHRADMIQVFRTRLSSESSAAAPFLSAGIPAIELKPDAAAKGPAPALGRFLGGLASAIGVVAGGSGGGFPSTWDRHYVVLGEGARIGVLKEGPFLILVMATLLGFIAFFVVASIVIRDTFIAFMNGFLRFFLSLIFAFGLVSASVYGTSLAFSAILSLAGNPALWTYSPAFYLTMKAILLLSLLGALSVLALRTRILPLSLAFYGGSSILLLFADVLIFSSIDLSFSLFFAWAFICSVLAVVFRSKTVSILAFLASFSPLAWFAAKAAPLAGTKLAAYLIAPGPGASVALAFIILPIVLLLLRILMIVRGGDRPLRPGHAFSAVAVGLALSLASLLLCLIHHPFRGRPIPTRVEALADEAAGTLTYRASPALNAGDMSLSPEAGAATIELTGAPLQAVVPFTGGFRSSTESSPFLSRKRITVTLLSGDAERLDCVLRAGGVSGLYDCNFPFTADPGSGQTRIHIGAHPPFPLRIEITVSGAFSGVLELRGRRKVQDASLSPPYGLESMDSVLLQEIPVE